MRGSGVRVTQAAPLFFSEIDILPFAGGNARFRGEGGIAGDRLWGRRRPERRTPALLPRKSPRGKMTPTDRAGVWSEVRKGEAPSGQSGAHGYPGKFFLAYKGRLTRLGQIRQEVRLAAPEGRQVRIQKAHQRQPAGLATIENDPDRIRA
jgi:hypothetical protein